MITLETIIEILKAHQLLVDEKSTPMSKNKAEFSHISVNSNDVVGNSLFICKGNNFKVEYALQAIHFGANTLLLDESTLQDLESKVDELNSDNLKKITLICTNDIKKAMAIICKQFYGSPDEQLKIIGITGTKGKTTTTSFLKTIIDNQSSSPVGYIGTHHAFDGKKQVETTNTTPEAHELYKLLHDMVENGCMYCVLEISSQALKYDRTFGLNLELAGLTNIGKDHISPIEHPDVKDYVKSKMKIFKLAKTVVCNREIALTYENKAKLLNKVFEYTDRFKNDLVLLSSSRKYIDLEMKGSFNQTNAKMAITMAKLLGFDETKSIASIRNFQITGRMEIFESMDKRIIGVVDYAHTKESYIMFFDAIKQLYGDCYLIAYFGVSGNKAKNRFKELPKTAALYCDYIIITSDEPGGIDPEALCKEIEDNIPYSGPEHISIPSRDIACEHAFKLAREVAMSNQVVVCALGKGDEDFCYCDGGDIPIIPDTKHVEMKISEYNSSLNM